MFQEMMVASGSGGGGNLTAITRNSANGSYVDLTSLDTSKTYLFIIFGTSSGQTYAEQRVTISASGGTAESLFAPNADYIASGLYYGSSAYLLHPTSTSMRLTKTDDGYATYMCVEL